MLLAEWPRALAPVVLAVLLASPLPPDAPLPESGVVEEALTPQAEAGWLAYWRCVEVFERGLLRSETSSGEDLFAACVRQHLARARRSVATEPARTDAAAR